MNVFMRALAFACIAAIGNGIFVYGQKKSIPNSNPFIFLTLSLTLCVLYLTISTLSFSLGDLRSYILNNWKAVAITGTGLFITYVGFYLLYSRFGASYYIIYAVASIVTTAIIVGVVVFREPFNIYHLLSIICAFCTIALFFMGQRAGK
jgi:drug/metabolite transporter (DMT)-like permease